MNKEIFQSMVRRILNEEVEKKKRDFSKETVPEMTGGGIDPKKKDKTFGSDANTRDRKSKEELLSDLQNIVGKDATVVWDDHDDLMVRARDMRYLRISPNWEDNYKVEVYNRNEDRKWLTNMDWDQIKDFTKENFTGDLAKKPTAVEKAYDKSYRNRKDETPTNDKGLPQKDKPKILPLTTETPKTTKNKDKNYTEDQVKKEDDLPNKPLKEVESFKKQIDHKVKDPVKLRKRKPDTKLTVKQS